MSIFWIAFLMRALEYQYTYPDTLLRARRARITRESLMNPAGNCDIKCILNEAWNQFLNNPKFREWEENASKRCARHSNSARILWNNTLMQISFSELKPELGARQKHYSYLLFHALIFYLSQLILYNIWYQSYNVKIF